MGKKPVRATPKAGYKAEPVAAAEPAEDAATAAATAERRRIYLQRKETQKWADEQLATLRTMVAEAKEAKCDWLIIAHEFHEIQLIKFLKQLSEKTLDDAPQELKDGLATYVSQFADKADVQQDSCKLLREIWDCVAANGSGYKRAPETAEAALAIDQLKDWTDCSAEGVAKFVALMKTHISSPGAQQAGLTRTGFLFSEAREGSKADGLTAAALMPCIQEAMSKHLVDPDVQRFGCSALRGVAMAPGQLPYLVDAGGVELAVEGLKAHYKVTDMCAAANGAFWSMAQVAGKNSPEVTRMRTAGVTEILLKVMSHHAWDQTLCGRVRVTLPFLQED